jgi:hypothetical protein
VAAILRLVQFSNRETRAILRELAALADEADMSLALCFRSRGVERLVVTGAYKASPALGVNAAVRMKLRMTQMQSELE